MCSAELQVKSCISPTTDEGTDSDAPEGTRYDCPVTDLEGKEITTW
jgi:hypothetical protein